MTIGTVKDVAPTGWGMNPVEKALWFVESHFGSDLALSDIAQAGGVSRFHMTRAFSAATGRSVMQCVRGRPLSEAAKALSNSARDILSVALSTTFDPSRYSHLNTAIGSILLARHAGT